MRWFRKQWIVKLFFKCNTAENSGAKIEISSNEIAPVEGRDCSALEQLRHATHALAMRQLT